jgi:hypothetical protein
VVYAEEVRIMKAPATLASPDIDRIRLALWLAVALALLFQLVGSYGQIPGLGPSPLEPAGGLLVFWLAGHCDGMDGPVVTLARKALETGNVNLVLPWVQAKDEGQIRHAFEHTTAVRKISSEARDLADMHFFETLVRVHRAGEGAPYTGLKPAGRDLGPAIPAADKALEDGSIDQVVHIITDAIQAGLRTHFERVMSKRNFDPNDVEAGREYVEAYVPYIHYVERLYQAASGAAHGHYAEEEQAAQGAHAH